VQKIKNPYIHIPAGMFLEKLTGLLQVNVYPEIGVKARDIKNLGERGFDEISQKLNEHEMGCTVHAPFSDLEPGASDEKIRDATLERFKETIHLTRNFPKKNVVFHHGYREFIHKEIFDDWFENSLKTWDEVLEAAQKHGFYIVLENIYEKNPDVLCKLMEKFKGAPVGVCFDPGHANIFSDLSPVEWLDALKPHLVEIHLHDNNGDRDAHMGMGNGNIDFEGILKWLSKNSVYPVCVLEIRNVKEAIMSLNKFRLFEDEFSKVS